MSKLTYTYGTWLLHYRYAAKTFSEEEAKRRYDAGEEFSVWAYDPQDPIALLRFYPRQVGGIEYVGFDPKHKTPLVIAYFSPVDKNDRENRANGLILESLTYGYRGSAEEQKAAEQDEEEHAKAEAAGQAPVTGSAHVVPQRPDDAPAQPATAQVPVETTEPGPKPPPRAFYAWGEVTPRDTLRHTVHFRYGHTYYRDDESGNITLYASSPKRYPPSKRVAKPGLTDSLNEQCTVPWPTFGEWRPLFHTNYYREVIRLLKEDFPPR